MLGESEIRWGGIGEKRQGQTFVLAGIILPLVTLWTEYIKIQQVKLDS